MISKINIILIIISILFTTIIIVILSKNSNKKNSNKKCLNTEIWDNILKKCRKACKSNQQVYYNCNTDYLCGPICKYGDDWDCRSSSCFKWPDSNLKRCFKTQNQNIILDKSEWPDYLPKSWDWSNLYINDDKILNNNTGEKISFLSDNILQCDGTCMNNSSALRYSSKYNIFIERKCSYDNNKWTCTGDISKKPQKWSLQPFYISSDHYNANLQKWLKTNGVYTEEQWPSLGLCNLCSYIKKNNKIENCTTLECVNNSLSCSNGNGCDCANNTRHHQGYGDDGLIKDCNNNLKNISNENGNPCNMNYGNNITPYISSEELNKKEVSVIFDNPKLKSATYNGKYSGIKLAELLYKNGPIGISVTPEAWYDKININKEVNGNQCCNNTGHRMTLVGYSYKENGEVSYFKIMNTWGLYQPFVYVNMFCTDCGNTCESKKCNIDDDCYNDKNYSIYPDKDCNNDSDCESASVGTYAAKCVKGKCKTRTCVCNGGNECSTSKNKNYIPGLCSSISL